MNSDIQELQLDGLSGPTHHFGGLSFGNLASMTHAGWYSRPRQAALQGLAKMRQVVALGVAQAILPPLPRPDLYSLRQVGFSGTDTDVLRQAAAREPYVLHLAMSSAFMWAANVATVIPSRDSADGCCHIVVANLAATPHRVLEGPARAAMLRHLFAAPHRIAIHDPLPPGPALSDEGAANHCRFAPDPRTPGLHLFVYGQAHDTPAAEVPRRFPARQRLEASRAVARLGELAPDRALFVRQQARAIDAGAFHNDVVMVHAGDRLLLHECALVEQDTVLRYLRQQLPTLQICQVAQRDLSLQQAVKSYLFNSQLLQSPRGYVLLAPLQSSSGPAAKVIRRLYNEGFMAHVLFQDLEQSMAGGGGPACLRLRLPFTAEELASVTPGILLHDAKLARLEAWVKQYYRDTLTPHDLADPQLLRESYEALDALTQLLDLGALYHFQQEGKAAVAPSQRNVCL
jgi:succinylarginine dihydrolase